MCYCVVEITDIQMEPDELAPADEKILDLLQDGRVTTPYAADETGYSLQYTRDRLTALTDDGHCVKVYDGLYELVDDPRGDDDDE